MQRWRIIGFAATLILVIALPVYVWKQLKAVVPIVQPDKASFVGSRQCADCHKKEYRKWLKSDHFHAMAVADNTTVLADFDNTSFEKDGIVSRFYIRDNKYFVSTRGPDGRMGEFQITHTFGWKPLQQYLVPFPGGRLQCLPIAWNVKKKKWFHLYPKRHVDPKEWLYWTNQGQNWNSMCADCHSTRLHKGYDPVRETYATTWSEINVGCEACHGPASRHVAWGRLTEPARPDDDGLVVRTTGNSNQQQVELCAPCHSRRSMLGDYRYRQPDLLDTEAPRILESGLYHADGRIQGEVYVYGSFVQSKMYTRGVRCSDCHDVHTGQTHKSANKLCLQCHQAALYDTTTHHFHKKEGEPGEPVYGDDGTVAFAVGTGAQCVQCHMPGVVYMGNDYRPDHSIRVPRPDLSLALDTPNACNRCHEKKSRTWAAQYTKKWYGSKEKFHYGSVFYAAEHDKPSARGGLINVFSDPLSAVIVRATALNLLGRYRGEDILAVFIRALAAEESLIRRTALTALPPMDLNKRIQMVGPLLDDPVKGVRIEAARILAGPAEKRLPADRRKAFDQALKEYIQVARYSADFSISRNNLGALYVQKGDADRAETEFKKAVAIDRDFYTAGLNLAVLYAGQGKKDLAEKQLLEILALNPDLAQAHYSLGLLLAEMHRYRESVSHLQQAATVMVNNGRLYYNLGQLLAFLGRNREAEQSLRRAVELEPDNITFLAALAKYYLDRKDGTAAAKVADKMSVLAPNHPLVLRLRSILIRMGYQK